MYYLSDWCCTTFTYVLEFSGKKSRDLIHLAGDSSVVPKQLQIKSVVELLLSRLFPHLKTKGGTQITTVLRVM